MLKYLVLGGKKDASSREVGSLIPVHVLKYLVLGGKKDASSRDVGSLVPYFQGIYKLFQEFSGIGRNIIREIIKLHTSITQILDIANCKNHFLDIFNENKYMKYRALDNNQLYGMCTGSLF